MTDFATDFSLNRRMNTMDSDYVPQTRRSQQQEPSKIKWIKIMRSNQVAPDRRLAYVPLEYTTAKGPSRRYN